MAPRLFVSLSSIFFLKVVCVASVKYVSVKWIPAFTVSHIKHSPSYFYCHLSCSLPFNEHHFQSLHSSVFPSISGFHWGNDLVPKATQLLKPCMALIIETEQVREMEALSFSLLFTHLLISHQMGHRIIQFLRGCETSSAAQATKHHKGDF